MLDSLFILLSSFFKIPKHMPYFTVAFGLDDGYAHIIENNEAFPSHFAKVLDFNINCFTINILCIKV